MKNSRCLQFVLIATYYLTCSNGLITQVRNEEYLGCYGESEESRVFSASPGDYDPNDISPLRCLQECGRNYKYAALQDGRHCLCSNTLPNTPKLDDSQCNTPCQGSSSWPAELQSRKCGGQLKNSIYNAGERILGFTLHETGDLRILEVVKIYGNLTNGINVTYTFDLGDGTLKTRPSTKAEVSHIFDAPGSYVVTATASNVISGKVTASQVYNVDDPKSGVRFSCPPAAKVGSSVACNGTLERGSRVNATFVFSDGKAFRISISARYYSAGTVVPRGNDSLLTDVLAGSGAIVLPAYTFQHNGRVTHWDVEITKAGAIKLMIFRPECSGGENYCIFSHSCVSSSTTCVSRKRRACGDNEMFCMFRKCCVSSDFTTSTDANGKELKIYTSRSNCSLQTAYNYNTPKADYKLLSQKRIVLNNIGHHITAIPLAEQPEVMEGDVLGWVPETGYLAYKTVTDNDGAAFQYTSAPSSVGSKLLRSDSTTLHKKHFVFAAHYAHNAKFVIQHKFDKPGIKSLTSNITKITYITIDLPISGVSFLRPVFYNTNNTVKFEIPSHAGTNATYHWDFGNGHAIRSQQMVMNYPFPKEGRYRVRLTAANSISLVVVDEDIYIFDTIKDFKFKTPIQAMALGTDTRIEWQTERGTNITYVVDFGDGAPRYTAVTTLFASRSAHATHRYGTVGNYVVTVYAYNKVGPNVSITSHAVVEIPLAGLVFSIPNPHITRNIYLAVGSVMVVNRHYTSGTNIRCRCDFKDGSPVVETTTNSLSHTYTITGTYHPHITCYNDVNSINKTLNGTIVVQVLQRISGLSVSAPPTVHGSRSELTLRMATGTVFVCEWEFGDGNKTKTDFSFMSQIMYHRYSKTESYNVLVKCKNEFGIQSATVVAEVDIPIGDVTITSSVRYIQVGNDVRYDVRVTQGSRMRYTCIYGDGESNFVVRSRVSGAGSSEHESFSHKYSTDGVFLVKANISNSLGSKIASVSPSVVAEYPVPDEGLILKSNAPVRLTSGNVTYSLSILPSVKSPTNAMAVWTFGDNTPASSPEPVHDLSFRVHLRSHRFMANNTFVTTVNISNHVSHKVLSIEVKVQKIKRVTITPWRVADETLFTLARGYGPDQTHFPTGATVVFTASSQEGDTSYSWYFGDGDSVNGTTTSMANHSYSSAGTYTVRSVVQNQLDELVTHKQIIIQDAVGNVTLRSNLPNYFRDPTLFFINVNSRGSSSCAKLAFGDNAGAIFGGIQCRPSVFRSNETFFIVPDNQTEFNHTYTFSVKGNYSAVLTLWNHVSISRTIWTVYINQDHCVRPIVRINGKGTRTAPRKVKRSERLLLTPDIKYNCPVGKEIIFTWTVYEVTLYNPDDTSKPYSLPIDLIKTFSLPTDYDLANVGTLAIEERTLTFVTLKFTLTVGFVGHDRDLRTMVDSHSVWIEVEKSELFVEIKGGFETSVGYELNHVFDGSDSKDPDNPSNFTGFAYSWWCRKKDENFPSQYESPDPKGGCYENGHYKLNGTTSELQIYTGDLVQKEVYVFELRVKKEDREASYSQSVEILTGQPPTLQIKCVFNSRRKLNPLDRLTIESTCKEGCEDSNVLIRYEWVLRVLPLGSNLLLEKKKWTIITEDKWYRNTTTGTRGPNINVKALVFEPSRTYVLRLYAWKPGGYPGGWQQYNFTVNVPPSNGKCSANPLHGYAVSTKFAVICNGWSDEDLPLKYSVSLKVSKDEAEAPLASGFKPVFFNLTLGSGKEENNYTLTMLVRITDAYGMATTVSFTVRVTDPPDLNLGEVGDTVNNAVGSGDSQAATQIANAAGVVLNNQADKAKDDREAELKRIKFRGDMAKAMSNFKADSLDGVAQKCQAINSNTQISAEVDGDAQKHTIKALGDMGTYMSKKADPSINMDNTAKNMVGSVGNVVGASSNTAKQARNDSTADPSASTNNTKAAFEVVDQVCGTLLKQLVSGDKAKVITSPQLDVSMAVKDLDKLASDDEDEDAEEKTGGCSIPDPVGLFGGPNATTEEGATSGIGTTITATGENPFPLSGDDLNSKTIGLSLTDGNGKPLDLAGQTLEMYVPRDLKKNPLPPMELNHFTENDVPMRVHKFNRTTNLTAIAVEILPFDQKIKFKIVIRFEKRPTAQHHHFNHTFPNLEEAAKMKKKPHPFTFVINHVKLRDTILFGNTSVNESLYNDTMGQFFLGIKAINKDSLPGANTSYLMRIYLPACKSFDEDANVWTTSGCVVGNKTRAKVTHCVCRPGGVEAEEIETTAEPTTEPPTPGLPGEPVRVRRFKRKVFKLSLASSFFPAPNPIDFNKVFANVNFAENPVALSAVCSIFGLYLILALYCRREDKKDVERAGLTPLEDNDPSDRHHYEITVYTGYGKNAGSTAQISFILAGDEGEGEPRLLKDPKRKTFQRRGVDVFLATYPETLGEINYLHIWHDNSGRSPSWYLSRVLVEDLNNDRKYMFISESWLAVEQGDGTVDRLIPVAGKDEMTSFNHLFYSTTQKNFADGHLWFSIFMRPAKSRFTRLQRLSCCLTLLYCSMLANAMFYNIGGETDPSQTIHLGPLAFSPAQIGIGIMSSLVIVPVNIFIVTVFRSVEAKPTKQEMKVKKSRKHWWLYELLFCCLDRNPKKNDFIEILHKNHRPDDQFLDLSHSSQTNLVMDDSMSLGVGDDDINFRISKQERREEMEKKMKKKTKKKTQLPYWFLYVGWVVCGLTCFTCAFFVVLYGLQFGREKSAQWISSMLVSFFQDVLISQPIKVVAIALVIAVIIKKPQEDDDDRDKKKMEDEDWMHEDAGSDERRDKRVRPKGLIRLKPPNKEKLEKDRQQRFKEMKMMAMIKEVLLYVFFVACLCIVSYSHRDPTSYAFRKSMYETFVGGSYGGLRSFDSIGNRENFYDWAKTTLLNGLFKPTWYNQQPYDVGFTGDGIAYVVGGARLRQLRVEKESCEVPYQFSHLISPCKTWYGLFAEETGQYDVAWAPLKNESLYDPPFTFKSWEFYDSAELDSMPFMAYVQSYGGGGYAAELGESKEHALRVIKTLENNTWIDSQTRAVMTELSTYNPVANLFCAVTLIVEFLPTNGVFLYMDLKVSRLFATGGGFDTFLVVCELLVVLFFVVFMYQEFKQLYKMKKAYFKDFWNIVEFTMVVLVLTCVCMFIMRLKLVETALSKLEMAKSNFVSFSRVSSWSEAFMIMVALLVFTTWLKGIKLLRFNPRIQMLIRTLKGSSGPLATFSIVFLVFFLSYSLFAFAVFAKDLSSYYNFVATAETIMGLLLGSFDYLEMEEAQPIIGPIFFFTFMVFGNFIIMNMFLTIIMDVFAEVKDELRESSGNEFEVVEFMVRRFRKFTGMQSNKISMDDPEEKKEMEDKFKEDMLVFKKKKNRHRKLRPMDLVAQKFTRLDDSLKGFYCDEWAEERMLDDIVERKWGVNTDIVNQHAQDEMKEAEEQESIRLDMYAALDNYEVSPTDEDAFTFSFPDGEFKNDLSEA